MSKKYIIGVSSVVVILVIVVGIIIAVNKGDKEGTSEILDGKITVIRNINETTQKPEDMADIDDSAFDELEIMPSDEEADLPATNTVKPAKPNEQSRPTAPAASTTPVVQAAPAAPAQANSSGSNSSAAGTTNNVDAAPQQETNAGVSNSNTSSSTTAPIIEDKNEDVPSSPSESYDASNGKVYETPRIPVR